MVEVTEKVVNAVVESRGEKLAGHSIDTLTDLLKQEGLIDDALHFNGRNKDNGNYGFGEDGEVYNTATITEVISDWTPPPPPPESDADAQLAKDKAALNADEKAMAADFEKLSKEDAKKEADAKAAAEKKLIEDRKKIEEDKAKNK